MVAFLLALKYISYRLPVLSRINGEASLSSIKVTIAEKNELNADYDMADYSNTNTMDHLVGGCV